MAACRCGAEFGGKAEHCVAADCHQTFTCTYSGDLHRTGKHDVRTGPDRRRCLTVEEMEAKGMTRNSRGAWMSPGRS